ncbi:MAG: hypothetical protein R2728_10220 [Chitinophagales bacterium]
MHKETVSGKIEMKAANGNCYSHRASLSDIKTQKHLDKITDKKYSENFKSAP